MKLNVGILIFLMIVIGCSTKKDKTEKQEPKDPIVTCKCSDNDAKSLAYQIIRDFRISQNNVESDLAKELKLDNIDKRENCTWVVTFKMLEGYAGDYGLIKKRFACDSKEIYVQ